MTRKDYILIAGTFRRLYDNESPLTRGGVNYMAEALAYELKRDNPRFDYAHFMAVVRGERELNSKPAGRAQ